MTPILGIVTIGQTPRPDLAEAFGAEAPRAEVRVAAAARRLAADGAVAIVVACAGAFPDVSCPVPVLLPGRIVPAVAGALSRSRRVSIVTPNRAQVPYAERKWRADGFEPTVTWASPSRDDEMARAADELRGADLDLIVIDCMRHADDARRAMAQWTGRLVIAAQSVVARVAGALI